MASKKKYELSEEELKEYDFTGWTEESSKKVLEAALKFYNELLGTNYKNISEITEDDLKQAKKKYITKSDSTASIKELPDRMIIPTLENYQYSLSLHNEGLAFMEAIKKGNAEKLTFKDGKIYFDGIKPISEAEIQDMRTLEQIESIDLQLLRDLYSIKLHEFYKTGELNGFFSLHIGDLAEYLGKRRNLNEQEVAQIVEKCRTFHNMWGVFREKIGKTYKNSYYTVLNFESYDAKTKTITLSTQYLDKVIKEVTEHCFRTDAKGNIKKSKNGKELKLPTHSYLIKSSLATEKNKVAAENVVIIVTLIEQAGKNTPHIKASTIIERNTQLKKRLEETADASNKNRLLKRVFSKTWELLETQTHLKDTYKGIMLPDPKDPANIPTMKSLNMVFEFKHKGKKKEEQ